MIDMHCHVLPGIDDGSKDLEMSIEMLVTAEKNKTDKIIVTPHFYRGYFENKYDEVLKHVAALNLEAEKQGIDIKLYPGQEVFADKYTLDYYKQGTIKGLNNSKYLLIEFPMDVMPEDALDIIYELKLLGVQPIVAHPERYIYIWNKLTNLNKFIEEDCLFQINTSSILGLMGKQIKEAAFSIMDNGLCSFIASDAHSNGKRCPNLGEAISAIKKDYKEVCNITMRNAESVLNNEDIRIPRKKIELKKKGIFSFMFGK